MNDRQGVQTRHYKFDDIAANAETVYAPDRIAWSQLMAMYRTAVSIDSPVILELGTDRGAATTVFLQACVEKQGKLVSIDIRDCSDLTDMAEWQFVRSDSTDVEAILQAAPHLKGGIDILYIDSLHTVEHVRKELYGWYPYLKRNAWIYFDDIDPYPYSVAANGGNLWTEFACREIHQFVKEVFYANRKEMNLVIHYGSTGLAGLKKLTALGAPCHDAQPVVERRKNLFNILRYEPGSALDIVRKRIGLKSFVPALGFPGLIALDCALSLVLFC